MIELLQDVRIVVAASAQASHFMDGFKRQPDTEEDRLLQRVDAAIQELGDLIEQLKYVARSCPCGARSESPRTHPHVAGCPIGTLLGSHGTESVSGASGSATSEAQKTSSSNHDDLPHDAETAFEAGWDAAMECTFGAGPSLWRNAFAKWQKSSTIDDPLSPASHDGER